jgi:hypothetical protein
MKSFKQYICESESAPSYVVVRNNRVELRKMDIGSPVATFGTGATTAVLNGNQVIVTFRNGKIAIYKVNAQGTGVSGPYIR